MTKQEYERLYAQARLTWPAITRKAMKAIVAAYENAIKETQSILLQRIWAGKTVFDTTLKALIDSQLTSALAQILKVTEQETVGAIHRAYSTIWPIDAKYMLALIEKAEASTLFNKEGIDGIFVKIDHELILTTIHRLTQNAYTFSARVWNSTQAFKSDVINIISAGFANGRPVEKIAKDLQVWVKDGKLRLAKRYGKLTDDAAQFMRRVGKDVDWRALRLVRSEFGASLQQVATQQAQANFGSDAMVEWIRTSGSVHVDVCSDYAATRYFKVTEVPAYPHPNCLCMVRPVLVKQADTLAQLRAYVAGDFAAAPRIVQWVNKYYRPAA